MDLPIDLTGGLAPLVLARDDAPCRENPNLFSGDIPGRASREARETCAACPLRLPCLEYGIAHDELGIWGGKSQRERRLLRRRVA